MSKSLFKLFPVLGTLMLTPDGGLLAQKTNSPEPNEAHFFTEDTGNSNEYRWRGGLHYFHGTVSDLGELLALQGDLISQNGVRGTLGYVVTEELWGYPIEFLVEGGLMWHNDQSSDPDVWQSSLAIKLVWTEFPWNHHVRTRFGIAEGLSYVSHIPYTEKRNRGSNTSKHLLNYLEFSLAFNLGDMVQVVPIGRDDVDTLDRAWLVVSLPHRSGIWGTFGRDNNGESVNGGSNYVAIGVEFEF